MKSITCYNDNNECIGLVVYPEDGDDVPKDNIIKLLPIMEKYLSEKSSIFQKSEIEDGFISLSSTSEDEIYDIVSLLRNKISEKIIVPQNMGIGPSIRHRPLYFGISKEKKGIDLRFTELGDFNSFDVALKELQAN